MLAQPQSESLGAEGAYIIPAHDRLDGPLFVFIPEDLTAAVEKGVVLERYYNPGNLFKDVHIIQIVHEDRLPDMPATHNAVQPFVGDAKLTLHRFTVGPHFFKTTLGWQPALMNNLLKPVLDLAAQYKPALIRAHVPYLNAWLAGQLAQKFDIPYALSLHINQDQDVRARNRSGLKGALQNMCSKALERKIYKSADIILPVYRSILPYLDQFETRRVEVAYNVVNADHVRQKTNYELHTPRKILSVGRQFEDKNPENIIRAVADMPDTELTLVGSGPYHERLKNVAVQSGAADRIKFITSISNKELCGMMADYDLFALHTEYWELSKALLEPLLTGLPVVLNKREGSQIPELKDKNIVRYVENTPQAYRHAMTSLFEDDQERKALGLRACKTAQALWSAYETEKKFVDIYLELMER